jgi:hypothetical protein
MMFMMVAENDRRKKTGTATQQPTPPRMIGLSAGHTTDDTAEQTADGPEHRIEHA